MVAHVVAGVSSSAPSPVGRLIDFTPPNHVEIQGRAVAVEQWPATIDDLIRALDESVPHRAFMYEQATANAVDYQFGERHVITGSRSLAASGVIDLIRQSGRDDFSSYDCLVTDRVIAFGPRHHMNWIDRDVRLYDINPLIEAAMRVSPVPIAAKANPKGSAVPGGFSGGWGRSGPGCFPGSNGISGGVNWTSSYDCADELVDLIVTTIDPDAWHRNGGLAAEVYYSGWGVLIVKACPRIHTEVKALLDHLVLLE